MARNVLIDLEALVGTKLHNVVLVAKSDGEGYFVHALVDDGDPAENLAVKSPHFYELLDEAPANMKREDGGPLHTFAGVSIDTTESREAALAAEVPDVRDR